MKEFLTSKSVALSHFTRTEWDTSSLRVGIWFIAGISCFWSVEGIIELQPQRVAVANSLAEKGLTGERVCAAAGTRKSGGQLRPWAGSFLPLSRTQETRRFTRRQVSQKVRSMASKRNATMFVRAFVKADAFHNSLWPRLEMLQV